MHACHLEIQNRVGKASELGRQIWQGAATRSSLSYGILDPLLPAKTLVARTQWKLTCRCKACAHSVIDRRGVQEQGKIFNEQGDCGHTSNAMAAPWPR
jgi:hypothetical protein